MQAKPYKRRKNFAEDDTDRTDNSAINSELDDVSVSVNGLVDNMKKIIRDDGELKNGIVSRDAINPALINEITLDVAGNIEEVRQEVINNATAASIAAQTSVNAAASSNASNNSALSAKAAAQSSAELASSMSGSSQAARDIAVAASNSANASKLSATESEYNVGLMLNETEAARDIAVAAKDVAIPAGNKAQTFLHVYQVAATAPLTRYDGTALVKGDMWYNESEDTLYHFSGAGAGWRPSGKGGDVPAGTIILSVLSAPPVGYISMGDYLFSNELYPQLAEALAGRWNRVDDPTTHTRLVNVSGAFPRFMNTGGTVDAGRTVGSWQEDAIRNITGSFPMLANTAFTGQDAGALKAVPFSTNYGLASSGVGGTGVFATIDASLQVPTASENRPKNVAFYGYIKAWDVAVTPATVDVQTLVNQNEAFPTRYRHGRNMLVNGGFTTCLYYNVTALYDYAMDMWKCEANAGTKNTSRVAVPYSRSRYALRQTVLTASGTGANRWTYIATRVEGGRLVDAINSPSVISFTASASAIGTYSFAILHNTATNTIDKSYVVSYEITEVNSPKRFTVSIPALTSAGVSWHTGTGLGAYLLWSLGAGSDTTATTGVWHTGVKGSATGQKDLANTVGAWLELADVQWEVGTIATPFEVIDHIISDAQCKRYYQRIEGISYILGDSIGDKRVTIHLHPTMRIAPTGTITGAYHGTYFAGTLPHLVQIASNAVPANSSLGMDVLSLDARL